MFTLDEKVWPQISDKALILDANATEQVAVPARKRVQAKTGGGAKEKKEPRSRKELKEPKEPKPRKEPKPQAEPTDQAEQNKILANRYTEITPSGWMDLPLGTYIRYIDENNALKAGGRITAKINDTYLTITKASIYHQAKIWTIDIKKIKRLFKFSNEKPANHTGGAEEEESQQLQQLQQQTYHDSIQEQPTTKQLFMSQLGDKLLFDDNSVLADRITSLEKHIEKISQLEQQVNKLSEDLKIAIRIIRQLSIRQPAGQQLSSQQSLGQQLSSQSPRPQLSVSSLSSQQLRLQPSKLQQQQSQYKRH